MPHVEPYNGSTDPIDHLESYKALMTIQGATDALFCISFPATLRKAARAWYSDLRSGSIHSFGQLEHSFVAHFSTSRKPPRTSDSLFSLKQGENETLRHFVVQFNTATLEVRDLNEDMAISAMKRRLRESRFTYSLDKTLPRTYAELLERAYKYMRADEGSSDRRSTEFKGLKEKRRKGRDPAEPSRPSTDGRVSPPRRNQKSPRRRTPKPTRPRYDSYTPLSAPRVQILMEIKGKEYLRRPLPLKAKGLDQRKYCRFHRGHGHNTEQCIQLKDEIEALIRRGYLDKFRRNPPTRSVADRRPPPTEEATTNQPMVGVINMISKRLGPRTSAEGEPMKKLRPDDVITFTEEDVRGIQTLHDNAVVISATIANYDVKKNFVDNGSSTNILFYSTFSRMRLSTDRLERVSTPLIGFAGDAVSMEGEVTLPVTVGFEPR
ncbi:uncharacterized protein [Elaeis guineensis]|uniref:uncharacterized protein n=1 Tax=Elaeis guineensis var. tenera TaxID=51953 RepID=UPI003C6D907E